MSSLQRSGKTAPRLVQDIQDYDPAYPPGTGRNLLSEVPPVYPDRYQNQSLLPKPEQWSTSGTSKVSAVCSKCRYHLQVVVNHTGAIGQQIQKSPDHVHHFVYKSGRQIGGSSAEEVTSKGQVAETFHYGCSYLTCPATVSLRVVSPVLSHDAVHLLTDPELLNIRANEAIATHPERLEGLAPPLPINVLLNLRAYLSNALNNSQQSKSISAINKRFMSCFGVEGKPCQDLLEFLGFTFNDEGFWDPPRPNPWTAIPYQDQSKIFLDDVIHELAILVDQRPLSERRLHQTDAPGNPAYNDLLHVLEALDYPRSLRSHEFQMPNAPHYEDLGVVEDMSSHLIVEAFNRQVSVDPGRTPLYLNCLKSIGGLRGGDDAIIIDQAVQVAYAEGKYTDQDVIDAYKYFGLNQNDISLTEDTIVGKFYAFLSSTNLDVEPRQQLWRIGDSRRSERIKSAAEDRVTTVEQAQAFLGVDEKTPDDFIITMYTAKIDDNPSSKDLARRAVELISNSRKSDGLKHFLNTGEMGAGEMDIGDAYRLLQIPDRTVDEAAIMAAYTICVDEAPGQADLYNQALSIIAKEKNSPLLSSLVTGSVPESDRELSEWPVGLQNIGNTCYLNSLLQFYFSVRPFRDMVLNFDDFKMEINDDSLEKKKVGSRKVLKNEVERSQKFLSELRNLFRDMIASPRPYVIPGQELARLTLISPSNEAAIRRRSTISANRPSDLGEINGMPVMGPLGPPQPIITGEEARNRSDSTMTAETERPKHSTASDVDSESTLVSDGAKNEASVHHADDKENEPPPSDAVMTDPSENVPSEADNNISPSKQPEPMGPLLPPNQPPPVPPRPSPSVDRQKQLIEEVEIGAQQDVTEVINNVLFQSQCAIKPIGLGSDGEQIDQIKDLFYGRSKSYISADKGVRSKEEWWCDIKVDVATGSRDIYTAIDGAFDVQKVNVENSVAEQFGSISKLPPILQIQVQRVQFDPVKKSSFKSTHHLELLETIYLDRYMDTQQPEIMNRRRKCWEWKNSLKELEDRRAELLRKKETDGLDMENVFGSAKDVLEDLNAMKEDPEAAQDAFDIDPQLISELDKLSQISKSELAFIDKNIKDTQTMISSQFVDYKHLPYRLYAVFVHHGSVEFGHYYIYIFDFNKNVWRKYNDNEVTEVHDLDEIFENKNRPNPPTPYFLVYVNAGMKDRLVNPVCREIYDAPPDPPPRPNTDPATPMEGVTAATTTPTTTTATAEDVDMEHPPSYDEAWADKHGEPGTGDNLNPTKKKSAETGGSDLAAGWPSSNETNLHDVAW
ncbi:ubiquitin-specific protease ubp2 [Aspergillus wentii]|nr:ubiquitin-specific protease ubp2 [Aspergillus wentii]